MVLFSDLVAACRRSSELSERDDRIRVLADIVVAGEVDDVEMLIALATGDRQYVLPETDPRELIEMSDHAPPPDPTLTPAAVDAALRRCASIDDPRDVRFVFDDLVRFATAEERVFIASLAAGDAASGVPADIMVAATVRALGPRAMSAGPPQTDTTANAVRFDPPSTRVPHHPVSPIEQMRSSRAETVEEGLDAFASPSVEWSMGGPGVQVHRVGTDVFVFERSGRDITDRLDDVVELIRTAPGGDVVLEGHLVQFDRDGWPVAAPGLSDDGFVGGGSDAQVCFADLLVSDDPVMHEPFADRRRMLESMMPASNVVPRIETRDPSEAQRFFDEAVRRGHPGVLVKDLTSPYVPGRRTRAWRHVRPVHTLLLVVLGAERGRGRRSEWFSTLHLGALMPDGGFVMVGKTSAGLTDDVLEWQTRRLLELRRDGHTADDAILEVFPELIVEVAIDGVLVSERYPGGLGLQAARVRRYVHLPAQVADDIDSIRALAERDARPPAASEPLRVGGAFNSPKPELAARLPPRPPVVPPPAEPMAAATSTTSFAVRPPSLPSHGRRPSAIGDIDFNFPPFEDPVLLSMRGASRILFFTRVVAVGWMIALVLVAVAGSSSGTAGAPSGDDVRAIGSIGPLVAVAICAAGWWWSDRRTRNAHRLDGRRPSRYRCVTAWSAPIVVAGVLSVTLLRLEPNELFDVRPPITAVCLAVAVSRPFALVRRILATLIRLRFNALIGAAFVLDLVSFGLVWWRLAVWPPAGEPITSGDFDTLVSVGAAVVVALVMSSIAWGLILRAGRIAEVHRATSQRTRYEHRMLRLRNVDPTDPEVWWALVQRRANEQRDAERSGQPGFQHEAAPFVSTADDFVEQARRQFREALSRLGPDRSEVVLGRLRTEYNAVTTDGNAAHAPSSRDGASLVGGRELDVESSDAAIASSGGVQRDRQGVATLRQRLGVASELSGSTPVSPLEQLLEHAGSVHVEAALARGRQDDAEISEGVRLLPPRLYVLQLTRAVLVVALVATVGASVWLVTRTVSASLRLDPRTLALDDVTQIRRARLAVIDAFSIVLVCASLWSYSAAIYARRCRSPSSPTRLTLTCLLLATICTTSAFVIDGGDRGTLSLLLLLPATASATVSVVALEPAVRWFRLRSAPSLTWAMGLPLVLALVWAGRFHTDVIENEALSSQTFFAILIGLLSALICAVAVSSTVDLEDGIRLSPELAVPARGRVRRSRRRARRSRTPR